MKGSLVHAIIASLDDKEQKRFLGSGSAIRDWEQLARLFRFLANQEAYSETDLLKQIGQTKRQKNSLVEKLGDHLLNFLGNGQPDVIVYQIIAAAPRLIENRLDKQAIELIEWALSLAEQSENYQAIQSLWRLAELFPDPRPKFKGMSYEHALAGAANLVAYRQLEVRLRHTPIIEDVQERLAAITEIEASPLLESPGMALGFEARLLYWRIKAICKYLSKNYQDAIAPQTRLLEVLEERLNTDVDIARRWIKESGALAALFSLVQEFDQTKKVWKQISDFQTDTFILEFEKTKQLYPGMIAVGIDFGDDAFTHTTCMDALSLLSERPNLFPIGLQSDVLFRCACFFLASDRIQEAAKILVRLRGYQKSSIRPAIFAMNKLLEIVLEIEQRSFEDAIRLCKNLRMSKHDQCVPGLATGLHLLSSTAMALSEPNTTWKHVVARPNVVKQCRDLQGQSLLTYFDLVAWMEAKSQGGPMMNIFRHRVAARK